MELIKIGDTPVVVHEDNRKQKFKSYEQLVSFINRFNLQNVLIGIEQIPDAWRKLIINK